MKLSKIITAALLLLFSFGNAAAQNSSKINNAYDVLNKVIDASGGKEYLLSIHTLYTDMSTEMEGRQVHWVTKEMLPNKGAFQIVYNNRIVFQNFFDGKKGYEIVRGEKKKADQDEFKNKKYKKNIFNELDYIDSSLWKIELIGEEKVGDENCYKIRATLVNGEIRNIYYSKTSFYMLREEKIANAEKDSFSIILYSDYKRFGKLTYYTVLRLGEGDKMQTLKITELLMNEQVGEKDFN